MGPILQSSPAMSKWKMKPMPASDQYQLDITNIMNIEVENIELKENSQA